METEKALKSAPRSVLIVDDEIEYAGILAKRLSRRNFSVTTAFSGAQGILEARKRDFDVALVDLKMEDIDGLETLKILKKMIPDIRVIMLTGHGSAEAANEGMKLGASDYLIKPCDIDQLISIIDTVSAKN